MRSLFLDFYKYDYTYVLVPTDSLSRRCFIMILVIILIERSNRLPTLAAYKPIIFN